MYFKDGRLLDEDLIRLVAGEILALTDCEAPKLLVSFEKVEYLASAMLGKLITVQRRVQRNNGKLAFCSIPPDTYEIFRISRLDHYFTIYPDPETAVAAMG